MTLVTAAAGWADVGATQTLAERLAERARRSSSLTIEPLLTGPGIAAHGLLPGSEGRITISRPDERTVLVGLPASVHGAANLIASELEAPGTATGRLPHGRWIALRRDQRVGTLRVLNDPLGTAWLYHARRPGGHLLSSDPGALLDVHDGPLTVNRQGLLAQLALGHIPTDATLFDELAVVPPGAVLELGPGGSTVLARHRPAYGDRFVGLAAEAKYDLLDELLRDSVRDWTDERLDDVVVSLSGGTDSPHALAAMLELRARPRCVTWGVARSENAVIAGQLARAFGLDWTLVERPHATWAGWLAQLGHSDTVGFDWAGWAADWLDRLAQLGSGVLVGFLGDALSGKHLLDDGRDDADWLDSWLAFGAERRWLDSPLLRPASRARIRAAALEQLRAALDGVDVAFPHQRALHLDLYGRQRRMIAGQNNLTARHLAPLTHFYTRGHLEFWSNVGWPDQRGQALYLGHARARQGKVFDIVLGERRRREQGRPLARATRRARLALAALIPAQRQRIAPTGADLMGSQLRFSHEIRALIASVAGELEPIIDVAALENELERFPGSPWLSPARLGVLVGISRQLAAGARSPADPGVTRMRR